MKSILSWVLQATCLLIPIASFSQFPLYRNFNVKDGLPSSEVYDMLEESSGYIWFGTDMGVSRYNGYEFKNYTTEDGLPDNTVFSMHEDHNHNIWFHCLSNKVTYYKNGKIIQLQANDTLPTILHNYSITSLYVDKRDTIWIGCNSTFLLKIYPGWGKHSVHKIDIPSDGEYIAEIDKGFIFGGQGLSHINLYKKIGKVFTLKTEIKTKLSNPFRLKRLPDNSYITFIDNLIIHFDDQGIIKKWEEDAIGICALDDRDNGILIGTFNGVRVRQQRVAEASDLTEMFDRKIITAILRDRESELWICTKGHGVFYKPYDNFKYYTTSNGLSQSSISTMAVLGEGVVSGHLSGELCFLKKNKIETIRLPMPRSPIVKPNEVSSILNDSPKKKYVGTLSYLYAFSIQTKLFTLASKMAVKKILASPSGNLVFLQSRHLKELTPENFREIFCMELPCYADNIFQDNSGKVWICSSKGLLTYDMKTGLQNLGITENKLLLARMVDIKQDNNKALWMVSRGEGVIVKDGNVLTQIKQKNGLSSNMCRTIFIDSSHVVWVGTNNGLNKITVSEYNPLKYTIDTYYNRNGLLTNEINSIVMHNGELWLGHNDGISVVDPKNIKSNKVPPPIHITEVLINGKTAESKNLNTLTYSDNYVTIKYNGISYKGPGNLAYKYKMEGMNTTWTYTNYTSLTFNTIQPGSYRFSIYAQNNDGYWSTEPATLRFTITAPWWQTRIFIIFAMTAGVLFISLAFRHRLHVIKKREYLKTLQQTRLSDAELKALRSQMNPHFVFNAINSVLYFITSNDPASSQKYLSKFAKLIRYVVDNSKPANIPLHKELDALHLYLDLESLRFENKFEYKIEISNEVDVDHIQIPSMLIQPFVENAIWHGLMHKDGKGRIIIKIEIKENVLICTIEDNGIGRKKSQEINKANKGEFRKSVGMSITLERLDIMNQKNNSNLTMSIIDLEDNEGNCGGTRVELNLPCY